MPKYLLHTPHMNCLAAGGSGLFSLVPGTGSEEEEEGSSSLGTFIGEPEVRGVPHLFGDSATILVRGAGAPTTSLGFRGLLLIAVVTSCCC